MYRVYDEYDQPSEFVISNDRAKYFEAYRETEDGLEHVARIRHYNNHMCPFENLDNGIMYDSVHYLCEQAITNREAA